MVCVFLREILKLEGEIKILVKNYFRSCYKMALVQRIQRVSQQKATMAATACGAKVGISICNLTFVRTTRGAVNI